jgi:cell wall-associated protease
MLNKKLFGLSFLLATQISHASIIAVVDSGSDFKHIDLAPKAWINPLEIPSNDRDEDKNGYPDDINGWNFAESNNQLIDYSYKNTYTDDTKMFFEVQLRSFLGTITEADKTWYKEKIKDESFIKTLSKFGNWMHGTHVTGITVKNNDDARAVGIKLIPTEVKTSSADELLISTNSKRAERFYFGSSDNKKETPIKDALLQAALGALAKQQGSVYSEIGTYIKNSSADVMNGSFGTPYSSIEGIIGTLFTKFYKRAATPEELKKFTNYYFSVALEETKKFLAAAPDTLFVFAAGNEGTNNDELPTTPANVQADNKITVAATLNNQSLANFSNYGVNNVEVAAPGVGIVSTIPLDHYLAVSGTSQASPYVANVAGLIKDTNPKLTQKEIKKIILGTVDVKDWLKGKVSTSGVVNRERAVRAALLSTTLPLKEALKRSYTDVQALTENELENETKYFQVPRELVLPLPNPISISL